MTAWQHIQQTTFCQTIHKIDRCSKSAKEQADLCMYCIYMYYYFSHFIVQSASVFTLGKPFCQAHCVTRHLGRMPTKVNLRCVNPASDVPSFPMEILVPTITTWHIIRTALTFIDMHFSCIDMLGVYLYELSQLAG